MIDLIRSMIRREWPMRLLTPLFGRYHPFHPDYLQDPYPAYRRLREEAPVYRHPLLRIWVLSRHSDISGVLKDPRFSVDRTQANVPAVLDPTRKLDEHLVKGIRSSLLMLDPPDHTRIRTLVNKAFTPRRIDALRPRIGQIVDDTLDGLTDLEDVELMRDFAVPVPIRVIAELLGVPVEDRALFKKWSTSLVALLDPFSADASLKDAQTAYRELDDYFKVLFESRRRDPQGDMVSALVEAREAGDRLDDAELLAIVVLILGAGHETTTNLIGNAVTAMLEHPDERKRLQDDPSLIATAVDEFLRWDSPVQATDRVVMEDLEIGGVPMKKGEEALLLLGSANRDEEVFDAPERLDLGRTPNPHLSFSSGHHFCLGAQLAIAEGQIALAALLRRFPDFTGPQGDIRRRGGLVLRGPRAVPLRLRGR